MKFGTSIMIFLLSIIALVAEFILYMVFGFGAAFSGNLTTISGAAIFFVPLMILTAAAGILAPFCALLELIVRRKNIGIYTMIAILGIILVGLIIFGTIRMKTITENKLFTESKPSKNSTKTKQHGQDKIDYFDKIIIRNIHIGKSTLGEDGVYGEVKNIGNKTLKEVEITIYCLDKDRKSIFEKIYHPVLVSEWSFTDNEPLKPNYSKKFGVKLDDAPSDWAKIVNVKVTDIEFLN